MSSDLRSCPSCGRRFTPEEPRPPVCPRCEADLSLYWDVAETAEGFVRCAIVLLPRSPVAARRFALRSRWLHNTAASRRVAAMAHQRASSS